MKLVAAIIFLCITLTALSFSQKAYDIPFTSSNNTIELTIANTSWLAASNVIITPENTPSWLKLSPEKQYVKKIDGHKDEAIQFKFAVDKTAPVKSNHELIFSITTPDGQKWTKKITITVRPPERFELFQNYPNPFNPTTTISYQLPHDVRVIVKLYSPLGEEVRTLVNEEQSAGYQSVTLDASSLASGVYFYRVQAGNSTSMKKMLLLK